MYSLGELSKERKVSASFFRNIFICNQSDQLQSVSEYLKEY